jgi:phosphoribosylanthranilate isomerase
MLADAARAAGSPRLVGVFVDPDLDYVVSIRARVELDAIQLHGDEDAEMCAAIAKATYLPVWKAIHVAGPKDVTRLEDWPVEAIMLDAPTPGRGGAGVHFDWGLARDARERYPARTFVLAGGLDADNVTEAIATVEPWAVDVATGVEAAPGIKDADKLAAFVAAVRRASPR